jgi:hypothetical protein
MPDLNHSTQEIMVWPDEMCAACKKNDAEHCPLLSVLVSYNIEFVSGCRVWECKLYDPDTESEHYIPEIGSPDRIDRLVEQSIKALTKQIEYLLKRANECP